MPTDTLHAAPSTRGRPAVEELAELLLLRRRPAVVAIVAVIGLGLLLAVIAPGLVPATPLVGLLVGLVAVAVAVAAMLATDAVDPIVRGPRHVRVSGRTVVGRTTPLPAPGDLADAVGLLTQELQAERHVRVVVAGVGHATRPVAEALVRGVAAQGHSALLLDLADTTPVRGIADTLTGATLAEVVRIDPTLRLAIAGAGTRPDRAAKAAAELATTPPSDLDLLVTALPADARPEADLAESAQRLIAVVPLGTVERDEVERQLSLVERSRSVAASVIVVDVLPPAVAPAHADEPEAAPMTSEEVVDQLDEADAELESQPEAPEGAATDALPGADTDVDTGAAPGNDLDRLLDAEPEPEPAAGLDVPSGDDAVQDATAEVQAATERATAEGSGVDDVVASAVDAAVADEDQVADIDDGATATEAQSDGPPPVPAAATTPAAPVAEDRLVVLDPDDTAELVLPPMEGEDRLALRTTAALERLADDGSTDR